MSDAFAASLTVRAIGWALVQSLWQGALIGGVTAVALMTLRRGAASRRYAIACAGMAAIAALSVVTAVVHARELRTTASRQALAVPSAVATTDARGSAVVSAPISRGDPSRSDNRRDPALLPSCELVDLSPDSDRARALLRRCGGGTLR